MNCIKIIEKFLNKKIILSKKKINNWNLLNRKIKQILKFKNPKIQSRIWIEQTAESDFVSRVGTPFWARKSCRPHQRRRTGIAWDKPDAPHCRWHSGQWVAWGASKLNGKCSHQCGHNNLFGYITGAFHQVVF